VLDTRTGATIGPPALPIDQFRTGPVTSDPQTTGGFVRALGCVIDKATRSLVMCEFSTHQIFRLRGVDV
jgi:hypothetical protein